MRLRSLVSVVLTALLTPVVIAVPAAAVAQTETSVTMVGERGEYVSGGRDRLFAAHNATVELSGGPAALSVRFSGGTYGETYGIDLRTSDGRAFEPRTYRDDEVGLLVHGEGRACAALRSQVTVLDIAYAGSAVERFHAVYEQKCERVDDPALFGEVRYMVPGGDSDLLVAPGRVAWPETYPGVDARTVPVTFVNTGVAAVALGEPQITGASASSFSVGNSTCTSRLAPGASCVVEVGFRPNAAAPYDAVLTVPDSTTAGSRSVRLFGTGQAGTTSLQVRSEPGDPIGGGRSYDWGPGNGSVAAQGSEVLLAVTAHSGEERFSFDFAPPRNDVLLAGRTYVQSRFTPYGIDQPELTIAGPDLNCDDVSLEEHGPWWSYLFPYSAGRFTVHELVVGPYGVERLSLTFEQSCRFGAPAITGSLAYRSADAARPVPDRTPDQIPPGQFWDIAGTPHERNILLVAGRGLVAGYADGSFRPFNEVTRGQLAAVLAEALDLPPAPPAGFSDTSNSVFAGAIDAVVAAGIAGGYGDGTYRPADLVTRGQLATFLTRGLELAAAESAGFSDTADDPHAAAIDAVTAAGIAGGFADGTYRPRESVTRGQLATFLARALELAA